jgi:hypothetical protein
MPVSTPAAAELDAAVARAAENLALFSELGLPWAGRRSGQERPGSGGGRHVVAA